jgi:hypothetical protein
MCSTSRRGRRRRRGFVTALQLVVVALAAASFGAFASTAVAWGGGGFVGGGGGGGGGGSKARVNIVVSPGKRPPKPSWNANYFKTIQAAVNASSAGTYVLIEPGTYDEEVKVGPAQSGIWIRGMNRNTVIIDGQHKVGNGVEINKANDVWVENLTVRNFEFGEKEGTECPDEECGNEIWWNGGPSSNKIEAHGWWGSYLTAYDTGLRGGYGIFTGHETEGAWEHVYASGFADSGIYIGACQECDARVSGAVMENNALGYSGSNAGGELLLENSNYQHNFVGIAPNSEVPGDRPPPQDGECGRPNIEHPDPTPIITTTRIPRCTIIRNDWILDNNNLTVPVNESTGIAPWGAGVELAGDYADLVENNWISGNPNDGVLGFEYPNPTDGEALIRGEDPFFPFTVYFQLAGNRVSNNRFGQNGSMGGPFRGDIALMGGFSEIELFQLFGYPESHSVNNCALHNFAPDGTFPAEIEKTWGCQNYTTPSPGGGLPAVEYLVGLQLEADAIREAVPPVGQPAPPPQPTMPNPCEGVPANPLCPKNW